MNDKKSPMGEEEFQKYVFTSLTAFDLNIRHLAREVNEMNRRLQKLDEVISFAASRSS